MAIGQGTLAVSSQERAAAHGIVPTTGAEWNMMQDAITTIEGVANGLIEVGVKPATSAENLPAATAENPLSADITNVASRL
jgi:hypothetical protein